MSTRHSPQLDTFLDQEILFTHEVCLDERACKFAGSDNLGRLEVIGGSCQSARYSVWMEKRLEYAVLDENGHRVVDAQMPRGDDWEETFPGRTLGAA